MRITSTLTNEGKKPLQKLAIGDAVDWGRAERFVPKKGLDASGRVTVDAGWVAGFGDDAAYAYAIAEGPLDARNDWEWTDFNAQMVDLPPGASVKVTRWLVVGSPTDTSIVRGAGAALRKARWARMSGRILEEATGEPLAGARVLLRRSRRAGGDDALDGAGLRACCCRRATIACAPRGIGRSGPAELEVTVGEGAGASHDVIMSRKGTLAYHVRGGRRAGAGAARRFAGIAPTRDPHLGPPFAAPAAELVVSATGVGELPLPPGAYRVLASRGPQYAVEERRVDVAAGETATLAELTSSASSTPSAGAASIRTSTPRRRRTRRCRWSIAPASNLAEGLDVVVATDHNAVGADWNGGGGRAHARRGRCR